MHTPNRAVVASVPVRRVAIIASRYHEEVTSRLALGAKEAFVRSGVLEDRIDTFYVSGSFELSQAAMIVAKGGKHDAIVALGCLLRGETVHFEVIARSVASGLDEVGRSTGVPVAFGVLTPDTLVQALDRAGGSQGNKGEEAALAAMELHAMNKKVGQNV